MKNINVTTVKGFNNAGVYAKRGSVISVSEARAKELVRNRLIEDPFETKVKATPSNKMRLDPERGAADQAAADQAAADQAAADQAAADQAAADQAAADQPAKNTKPGSSSKSTKA